MNAVRESFEKLRKDASRDLTLFQLKAVIILWAIFVVVLVLLINNKWILAGILAYEVLP